MVPQTKRSCNLKKNHLQLSKGYRDCTGLYSTYNISIFHLTHSTLLRTCRGCHYLVITLPGPVSYGICSVTPHAHAQVRILI